MKSFYLTLISGSNQEQYNNSSANFTNKLPVPLDLNDNIEFGICELSYQHRMNNIPHISGAMQLFDHYHERQTLTSDGEPRSYYGEFHNIDFLSGWYANEDDLCRSLNRSISLLIPRLKSVSIFSYDYNVRRIFIRCKGLGVTLSIKEPLAEILGISGNKPIYGMKKEALHYIHQSEKREYYWGAIFEVRNDGLAEKSPKLNVTQSLFIYCDLVFQQYSGHTFSNLLRMCPVRGGDGQRVIERFEKVHYLPVSKHFVDTLSINIKTIEDRFVDLIDLTYVKLHFRRRK